MGHGTSKNTTIVQSVDIRKNDENTNVTTSKSSDASPTKGERRLSLRRASSKVAPACSVENSTKTKVTADETSKGDNLKGGDLISEEGYISCTQLFNLLFDGRNVPYLFDAKYLLIIDTRSLERYEQSHIITALHHTILANSFLIGQLEDYVDIILYSDEGQVGIHDVSLDDVHQQFLSTSLDHAVLIGGFDHFSAKFPFLCTNEVIYTESDREMKLTIYPSVILDDILFQGSGEQATNWTIVTNLKITHILNLGQEHPCPFTGTIEYLPIKIDDETSANLYPNFERIVRFVEDAVASNGRILIHCNVGVSRSSTATIAYLMQSRKWTLQAAHDFLKDRRPVCKPNRGFLKQLSKYEADLFGKPITNIDDLWL